MYKNNLLLKIGYYVKSTNKYFYQTNNVNITLYLTMLNRLSKKKKNIQARIYYNWGVDLTTYYY